MGSGKISDRCLSSDIFVRILTVISPLSFASSSFLLLIWTITTRSHIQLLPRGHISRGLSSCFRTLVALVVITVLIVPVRSIFTGSFDTSDPGSQRSGISRAMTVIFILNSWENISRGKV